jgi:type I restriction enzyme S subunit
MQHEPTDEESVSFVRMAAVEEGSGRLDPSASRIWKEVKKGYTRFQEADVLFAKITPCMENGKAALAVGLLGGRGVGSTEFHVLRPIDEVQPKFILHFLLQEVIRRDARMRMKGAAGQLRVPPEFLEELNVPLPPAGEQRRMVEEIEKQITRLEEGVVALKRVQANLKRYRAAVLNAAFEGRLVQTHPAMASIEPDMSQSAPPGWTLSTIEEKVRIIDYRGRTPPFSDSGVPHLRSSNIRNGKIIWDGLAFVSEETYQKYMTRGLPEVGDILFTTEAPLGEVALAPIDCVFSVAQRIMILRPKTPDLNSALLMYQIMSPRFQAILDGRGTGTTVTGVSSRNFRPAPILIPPIDEQRLIVSELERRLSVIDELAMQVEANLKRAERLRQAILKRAFEGKLVPQDPNDEPATVLLDRIKAERAKRDASGKKRYDCRVEPEVSA